MARCLINKNDASYSIILKYSPKNYKVRISLLRPIKLLLALKIFIVIN